MAIALTTAALIIILSAMNGLTSTVADLYNALEPDIKITSAKSKSFEANEDVMRKINSIKGIQLISHTLSDKALLKNMDKQALVSIKGVDANFIKITQLDSTLVEGSNRIADSSKTYILLGSGVADQLQLSSNELASELQVFSPKKGKSSSLNPEDDLIQLYASACGMFSLNDEFNFQYAFVNLNTAKKLFDSPNKITALEISCKQEDVEDIQEVLKQELGSNFIVKNRYQLNDVLFKSLETEKLATFIILSFILIIATFNIIGALTMLIIEKRKDIKTLYGLGADRKMIRTVFMQEGLLISGIGALLGLLIGLFVCWLQIQFHLVKFGSEFVIPYYPIELQVKDFLWIFCLIMMISFLAALYPIRIFTKTDLVH